ncbi:MAG: hypothetical protein KF729_22940 [Sandaracinaceae bacterium]|nr:hypothetical protein [Sandaracinaceae bacterium]
MSQPITVRAALAAFLAQNGFSTDAYDAPTVEIPFGPFTVKLPNSDGRKRIVRLHDLHHVTTAYGTDLAGEAEIGAWELRAGCTNVAGYVYNLMAVALGLFVAPLRTWRAFRAARGATTLYRLGVDYDALLAMPVATLRAKMGVPPGGVASQAARLHAAAPPRAA